MKPNQSSMPSSSSSSSSLSLSPSLLLSQRQISNSNSNDTNNIRRLSKDDIIETTGINNTDDIEELEILFLTCDEIGYYYCH